MTHCCSQCSFTAQFESALLMHHQLHHDSPPHDGYPENKPKLLTEKANTLPMKSSMDASFSNNREEKGLKFLGRTSSATRLLERLRTRITRTRSKTLFSHPEETGDKMIGTKELGTINESAPKGVSIPSVSKSPVCAKHQEAPTETFACHLCSFDADRITVLDRHLLNHHKIGLDNLLKLVMAKTKDGLTEDDQNNNIYGIRQPYYRPPDDIIEEGEFLIETVTPRIKVLKHATTNTEIQWTDIPDLKDNCRKITKELEKLVKYRNDNVDKDELMTKMQTLSECMCKFVDSTNTLKKVLTKEFDSKTSVRERLSSAEPFFDLDLSPRDTPREWEKAHSEKLARSRHKYGDGSRSGKSKMSSESFYF